MIIVLQKGWPIGLRQKDVPSPKSLPHLPTSNEHLFSSTFLPASSDSITSFPQEQFITSSASTSYHLLAAIKVVSSFTYC